MSKLLAYLLGASAAIAGASALPNQLMERAVTGNFSLFAYGTDTDTEIGGFPLFYYETVAYIANPAKVNYTADYVVFEKGTDDTTQWTANPLTTTSATWSDSLFYIPSTDGPVGFYKEGLGNITTDEIITTGFKFYGTTAMVVVDGSWETLWYAVPTAIDGLWTVGWNASGGGVTDAELLTVRSVAPPNVDYPSRR